ncbi:PAS domain S-box protein [Methylobacterium sp. WL6]|uniref:PAS domain-containing hybrid sensor histidine kinase/response regulator n=1 Tax=Methylobacterium sp. WL6 TaxID=2603901 RepID=UPI001FEECB9A|nr:PAS domain S-box protein [Methylobacterium sp. WL6]
MMSFLSGPGEMATRMRAFDWTTTLLGSPEGWPAGLRTAVRLLLNSHHPMQIFWGPEAIFFYNDGFVPSAGPERHPSSLGRPAAESWGEIWPVIGSEVDKVREGGGHTWYEDQHVPILRQGRLEDAYWTYGFSPIDDDTASNGIGGVISILTETTKRKALEGSLRGINVSLRAEGDRLREMFEQAPSFMAVVREPSHRFDLTNDAYRRLIGDRDVIGLTVREALKDIDGQPFFDLLDRVYTTGEPFIGRGVEIWLERTPGGPSERRIIDFIYQPIRDGAGDVTGIFVEGNDVTEMHAATEELREREQRLSLIVEAATDYAILTLDGERAVTSWSAGAAEIFGYDAGEIMGRSADVLFTPEDILAGQPAKELVRARMDGQSPDVRWHARKDGGRVFLNGSLRVLRDADGRELGFLKIARDETERRRVEDALRKGEERFRTIIDTVQAAFAIVQVKFDADDVPVDYLFVEANPAFEREAGVNLRGKWVTEFAPDLERFWFETYGRVARTRVPENFESYAKAFGRWFDVRAVPVGDAADRQIAIIFNDVTERRTAEERLRASEALARQNIQRVQLALAAGAIIGTWNWDLTTDRFTVDEAFAEAFGLDPALGRDGIPLAQIVATVHPDDQAGLAEAIDEVIARGGAYAHQYRVRRTDGKYYWLEANGRVEHAPDGTPQSFPGVLLDVETRRTVEAERDRALAALRSLNDTLEQRVAERSAVLVETEERLRQSQKMEAVGQLTGGLAHDFNNLLAGICGSLEMMQNRMQQGRFTDIERYMAAAQGASKRAAALTHRLLAFSRRQTLDPKPTDVNKLVAGMQEMVQRTVGPGIPVEVVGASSLWPTLVDPSQLENALLNLCINARDAMPDGGRITVETANKWLDEQAARKQDIPAGQYLSLSVTDTGTGMSPEVIARVFEPFFTTKPIGEGTGLGLSMIYGFAQQSGGQVRIYSEVGQGTTVCIYLPRHYGEVEDEEGSAGIDPLPRSEQGETVLVVDDEPTVRMLVTDILEELGYTAIEAGDSAAGLKVLQSNVRIDLLVTDVGLPGGMNGRQMADAARVSRPDLKVLFITGYAENAILGNGQLAPGMAVLTKPFPIEAMAARIRSMIEGRKEPAERT